MLWYFAELLELLYQQVLFPDDLPMGSFQFHQEIWIRSQFAFLGLWKLFCHTYLPHPRPLSTEWRGGKEEHLLPVLNYQWLR
jgi:hypothetical protein